MVSVVRRPLCCYTVLCSYVAPIQENMALFTISCIPVSQVGLVASGDLKKEDALASNLSWFQRQFLDFDDATKPSSNVPKRPRDHSGTGARARNKPPVPGPGSMIDMFRALVKPHAHLKQLQRQILSRTTPQAGSHKGRIRVGGSSAAGYKREHGKRRATSAGARAAGSGQGWHRKKQSHRSRGN